MLKGLALTPPVVGRISIGKIVERNGKRLPEKDDEFTITSQVQGRDGWIPHPLDQELRKSAGAKLRAIPVRLLFDAPELNLRASYCMFDRRSGRPLCVGNGETCRRATLEGIRQFPCPAPESCELAEKGACRPFGRMNVRIGDEDELASFIFRTAGFNSIRTLAARLQYFHAVSGGKLAAMPLELRLRGKSTAQSHGTPIYYVDLTTRPDMNLAQTVTAARALAQERWVAGIDQAALDDAARSGFARGAFEESAEDGAAVVEEFYPESGQPHKHGSSASTASLADRLEHKARSVTAAAHQLTSQSKESTHVQGIGEAVQPARRGRRHRDPAGPEGPAGPVQET
jgi:hypothetical protein